MLTTQPHLWRCILRGCFGAEGDDGWAKWSKERDVIPTMSRKFLSPETSLELLHILHDHMSPSPSGWCCLCPTIFESNQWLSVGLRFGLWLNQCRAFIWFSLNQWRVVSTKSLSCWRMDLKPLDNSIISSQESIFPLTLTSSPSPLKNSVTSWSCLHLLHGEDDVLSRC